MSAFFFSIVPYDSTKPFVWSEYLAACGAKAVPNIVFKQVCIQFCTSRVLWSISLLNPLPTLFYRLHNSLPRVRLVTPVHFYTHTVFREVNRHCLGENKKIKMRRNKNQNENGKEISFLK